MIEVVDVEMKREIVPMGLHDAGGENAYRALAIGITSSRIFLRGPSGKLYVCTSPEELVEELLEQKVTVPTEANPHGLGTSSP
jgi:hypothetical protein